MIASLAGTTIEFYDFYIFATAAALVIGPTFFPGESSQMQVLAAFMSFGLAFVARPVGSFLFGHFGDRFGRKPVIISGLVFTMLVGLLLAPLISSASIPLTLIFLCPGLTAMGWIHAPMGALLPRLMPTRVRYSGAGITYSLAGIPGASLAPYAARWLVGQSGLSWVWGITLSAWRY